MPVPTNITRHVGRGRLTPGAYSMRHLSGARLLINTIKAFSPDVLLVGGVGMLQTVGGSPSSSQGDPIGQWLDQSGNGANCSQATAGKRPTLNLNVTNNKPSAVFVNASGQRLEGAFSYSGTPGTAFYVFRDTSGATNERIISTATASGTSDNPGGCVFSSTSSLTILAFSAGSLITGPAYTLNAFHTGSTAFDGAACVINNDGATTTTADAIAFPAVTVYDIGGDTSDANTGGFFQGDICFAAIWKSFVTLPSQAVIRASLKTFYGTP